jgi:Ca2+-transporting ATPase
MTNRNRKNIKRNFEILVVTKGAPEAVIEKCDRIQAGDNIQSAKVEYRQEIIQANNVLASKGLRVLGVAFKRLSVDERIYKNIIENTSTLPDSIGFEQNLVFLGLVALTDPPRKEAIRAISQCKSAGIKVIMITGDNKITAESIAREMGISSPDPLDYENTNSENMLNSRIPDASGASVLTGSDIDTYRTKN